MTDNPTPPTGDLIKRLRGPVRQAAQDLIDAAFNNRKGRGVQFSIPAKPDEDTDLVLVAGIKEAADALEAAERVIAKLWAYGEYWQQQGVEYDDMKAARDYLARYATGERKGGGDGK